jgi:hypothetical protein
MPDTTIKVDSAVRDRLAVLAAQRGATIRDLVTELAASRPTQEELADVEGGYGDTLYKLHRASIKADLRTAKILQRLDIQDVSDEQIDAALDEE